MKVQPSMFAACMREQTKGYLLGGDGKCRVRGTRHSPSRPFAKSAKCLATVHSAKSMIALPAADSLTPTLLCSLSLICHIDRCWKAYICSEISESFHNPFNNCWHRRNGEPLMSACGPHERSTTGIVGAAILSCSPPKPRTNRKDYFITRQ